MEALTSAPAIRAKLLELIGDQLGTWKDGSPAIWIGQPPTNLAPATGIQCIIEEVPQSRPHNTSKGMRYLEGRYYTIVLTHLRQSSEVSKPLTRVSLSIVASVLERWVQVQNPLFIPASDSTAAQYRFQVFCPGFVDALPAYEPPKESLSFDHAEPAQGELVFAPAARFASPPSFDQNQVAQMIQQALLPHFDVGYSWEGLTDREKLQIKKGDPLTVNFNSTNTFGSDLFFEGVKYGVDWGQSIPYNTVYKDAFEIDKTYPLQTGGQANFTERYYINLTNSYGTAYGNIYDNRCAAYHMYIQIEAERTSLGSRTLAIVSRVSDPNFAFIDQLKMLLSVSQIPAIDGGNQMNFESSYAVLNLLEHRRQVIKEFDFKGDPNSLQLSLQLVFHQTSGLDIQIYGARLWARRVEQLIDPEMFRG